jgi:hypothetical protein
MLSAAWSLPRLCYTLGGHLQCSKGLCVEGQIIVPCSPTSRSAVNPVSISGTGCSAGAQAQRRAALRVPTAVERSGCLSLRTADFQEQDNEAQH